MPNRFEPILKVVCGLLALVLAIEVARMVVRYNPVGRLAVPAVPALPAKTNAAAMSKGTNDSMAKADSKKGTNSIADKTNAKTETNSIEAQTAVNKDKNT